MWRGKNNLMGLVYGVWCTRLAATSDKVYRGTLASSTTKTGRHDIAESGVKHNPINHKSNQQKNVLLQNH
jgi:hypothetical protein